MTKTRKLAWLAFGLAAVLGVAAYARASRPGPLAEADRSARYGGMLRSLLAPQAEAPTLRTVRVLGDSTAFGRIEDLEPVGGRLLLLDGQRPSTVALIDTATGAVVGSSGRHGEGPGEYVTPKAIDPAGGSRAWVYDFQNGRISLIDAASLETEPTRMLRADAGLFNPVWLGDTLVANGLFAGELLRFYTPRGQTAVVARAAGRTPFPRVKPEIALHLNRSALAVNPARTRVAQAFLFTSRLQFYGRDGSILRTLAGPEEVTPDYRVVDDPREQIARFVRSDATRFSYIDVTATDRLVYALFSGRSRGDFADEAYAADQLHVFDWDGGLVGVWTLDQDVRRITVDPATGALYGVRDLPYPAVVRFESPVPRR
jgi:hypothetical protein